MVEPKKESTKVVLTKKMVLDYLVKNVSDIEEIDVFFSNNPKTILDNNI